MGNTTLVSMFAANKQELEQKLAGKVLPRDVEEIKRIVTESMNQLLLDYQGSLQESERFVLNAALRLLDFRMQVDHQLSIQVPNEKIIPENDNLKSSQSSTMRHGTTTVVSGLSSYLGYKFGGSWLGLSTGIWAAAAGALIASLVIDYISSTSKHSKSAVAKPQPVNPIMFTQLFESVYAIIDELVETFRVQVQRIIVPYESKAKPSLQKDYGLLLSEIEALVKLANAETLNSEDKLKKLGSRITILAESLENYGLKVVDGRITTIEE